ncbi:lysine/ornithine N-monooxygenase [Frankia casuarinae]|uniref:L-lysine N6-monooxygenase MbtG n=1 Tax=Frankia casuarinae (strain DSM 45818 / CECT 9043 / HFP020203 / CcI3) TaxID=106370 RepID=Q2J5N5_FRACC|nr:L-lysine 6-monooxygenase (NADPH) [Frankia casuarinae]ETA02037.1 lysine/ornithine N-monooxygenase [Frankia sp. CcI6]KDA42219.1 lysine/ornithine N-monooxygenase [Frankia sp. BMG5.23]OHV53668.1 lysine 6-monooxygenase [Frankia sp. CgIS1]ORT48642.1 lysine 6-monooxygenase [Frankia sp. KB5]
MTFRAPSTARGERPRTVDDGSAFAGLPAGGEPPYDVVGVGLGPFNLSLAALADGLPGLRAVFFDQAPAFSWHPGLLLEGTTLQVPFLADLVTLIDPTSRWSFLAYLREHDRLFRFYLYERFHIPRREYDDYCRWVADGLDSTHFGTRVEAVRWDPDTRLFQVTIVQPHRSDQAGQSGASPTRVVTARHLVLGIGTEPIMPLAFAGMPNGRAFHAAEYQQRRSALAGLSRVTVVGSGQSGAEVFADLLRAQPVTGHQLTWITRTPAFAPMEYSKLGLEQFTPDFVRYFHGLEQTTKDTLVPAQWQLYKGIDADTIAEIYDLLYERTIGGADVAATLLPGVVVETASQRDRGGEITLGCRHRDQNRAFPVHTDAVVLATGYAARRPTLLDPMAGLIDVDDRGRFRVDARYRVATDAGLTGRVYVQNAELHTHGVVTPDLGLGAWRAAVILDDLTGGDAYRLPSPSAFTTFGVPTRSGQPDGNGQALGERRVRPRDPAPTKTAGTAGR